MADIELPRDTQTAVKELRNRLDIVAECGAVPEVTLTQVINECLAVASELTDVLKAVQHERDT